MAVMTPLGSCFLPATLLLSTPTPFHCRFLKTKLRAHFTNQNSGAAVVWFKHDLRIDDHPGIVAAASKYNNLVPLYVFDPRILSRFSDEMVTLLLVAVEDLRRSLKAHGSNLMIRFGNVENILRELAKEVKAPALFVEEEVEYDIRSLVATVEDLLAADPVLDWKPKIELWQTPCFDVQNLDDLPAFFRDVKKPQHNDVSLPGIPRLPGCFMELDWGHLPTSNDVGTLMDYHANRGKEKWYSIKHTSAEAVLILDHLKLFKSGSPVPEEPGVSVLGNSSQIPNETQKNRLKNSVFGTSKGNIVAGGTEVVFNALAGYLRYLEGTARDDWQEVHQRLRETEIRTGASFGALLDLLYSLASYPVGEYIMKV